MAKSYYAPFAQTPRTLPAVATAALGGLGTTSITGAVLVATAGADGSIVTKISAMPSATTTASSLVLFLVKAATPAVYGMIDSVLLGAYTAATTTAIPFTQFTNISESTPIRLEAGDKLYVGTQVALAAGIVFKAEWMDF